MQSPKYKQQKEKKTDKLGFIKIKNFYVATNTIKKVKSQLTEWKTIFENHISKGLVSRKYFNKILRLNNKKTA